MKVLLIVALIVCGCSSCKKKKPEDKSGKPVASGSDDSSGSNGSNGSNEGPPKCETPPAEQCNYANCGGNSAIINAFPLHGFRTNGDCNRDEMQLVPKSMDGGNGKCKGMTLDIEGDKLIGIDGANKCEALDLEGVTFEIRTIVGSERLTIVEVTEYVVGTAPDQKKFPAYRIEWKDNNGAKTALCSKGGQNLRKKLGVAHMKWSDDLPDADKELVIPIVSEIYDETGMAIEPEPDWLDQKPEWNHLACVDDALAKRTINGHHKPTEPALDRAALRIWTADYCGGRPFTMRGRVFNWDKNPNLPVEAQWTETGASCLTKPRIIFNNGKEEAPKKTTKLLDAFCKASGKDCKLAQTWTEEAKKCTKPPTPGNSTSTVDRTLDDCKPCDGSNCPLESRNVK